ncbi:hypothetical protein BJ912DRAFT_937829 [Pholiota molesta]|nr:hypothetical protein BJ912DRAFT_937829 [Pholiota molesta]
MEMIWSRMYYLIIWNAIANETCMLTVPLAMGHTSGKAVQLVKSADISQHQLWAAYRDYIHMLGTYTIGDNVYKPQREQIDAFRWFARHKYLITISSGYFAEYMVPGSEVVNNMMKCFLTHSEENFNKVVFPLNLHVFPTNNRNDHQGIGKVDLNSLIPSAFGECKEEWTTALVPSPVVSIIHFDHVTSLVVKSFPISLEKREGAGLDADLAWDRMKRMITE